MTTLTAKEFLDKFDDNCLTDYELKNIPAFFVEDDKKTGKESWNFFEMGYGYLIFIVDYRFFIKLKSDNKIFELKEIYRLDKKMFEEEIQEDTEE